MTLIVAQNDKGFLLQWTINSPKDPVTGVVRPFDLTDYTVTFKMWRAGAPTVNLISSGACTIVVAVLGTVTYLVKATDFATAGNFKAEFECTKSGVIHSTEAFDVIVQESA